ncbi:competence pheromone ComX [Paenibacillus sp. PL2-23]|uniref:competence pheromone ComX n=1 Tax=Paenibacillus sp. PL2-23 TaxID=2100729 RepID=UPI0030FBD64C
MLKEAIRQLAGSRERFSLAMSGQLQFAGMTAAEQHALLDELAEKDKNNKENGYSYMWD